MSEGKPIYRITNWSDYNAGLIHRGDVTLWFSPEIFESWTAPRSVSEGKVGRPFSHSPIAIQTMLTLRCLYRLPLRATQGLTESLLKLLGAADLKVPSYATLSRRQAGLQIQGTQPLPADPHAAEPKHVLIDSTGLKVYGEGEWKVRKHGPGKRRVWRKLHLAVDAKTRQIVASALTESSVSDPEIFPKLLLNIEGEIEKISADGAYDTWECRMRAHLRDPDVEVLIPPRENSVIDPKATTVAALERNNQVEHAKRTSTKQWKKDSGYHQRSVVETFMFRFKKAFGGELLAKEIHNQATEAFMKSQILNRFINEACPKSVKVES